MRTRETSGLANYAKENRRGGGRRSDYAPPNPKMNTNEEKLSTLSSEIAYHRRKGESLRKRAAAQDAIADAKVKQAAALGTPELPAVANPVEDGKTYPELARTAAYPPWKP